jgi:hypothetical protein
MHRRMFLAGAGGMLALSPLSSGKSHAAGGDVKILSTHVTNRDHFPNAGMPRPNEVLILERAPQRAFNPFSIAVVTPAGQQIGYLPPASTGILAALLDAGFRAFAIQPSHKPTGEPIVDVYLRA